MTTPDFAAALQAAFSFPHPSLDLGRPVLDGAVAPTPVRLPLSMANRHGLIAGATGTGKTKTLQAMAEQFSAAGVPVFVADIKGDLAGLCRPGAAGDAVTERARSLGLEWAPHAPPTQLWSLTGKGGAQIRASVSSFGPLLLSRVLALNETQASVLALVFRLCDEEGLLLLDLKDLRAVLQFLGTPEAAPVLQKYGGLSKATTGVLLRKLLELESQGGDKFLGEPELDLADLLATDEEGRGVVNILDLTDVQRQPKLFSTAMLWLLAQLYEQLPERGDADRPVLAFFFDEAHLLFDDAPPALLEQVEQVVRLIRSRGVGVWFVTQTPSDVPDSVLAQLGNRIQHALRAFTPKDRKAIKLTAENFPESPFYDVASVLTQMEIGDALCSVLNPRGAPSPTVVARIVPPASRMGTLSGPERELLLMGARHVDKYAQALDRESAHEILAARFEAEPAPAPAPTGPVFATGGSAADPFGWGAPPPRQPLPELRRPPAPRRTASTTRAPRATRPAGGGDHLADFLGSTAGRTLQREIVRGVFGLLRR